MILDCDPGLDDAVAIALALCHADVVGITTVGGNVSVAHTTENALAICDLLGRTDVAVHAGADQPLSGVIPHRATEIHGRTGLGEAGLPAASRPATSNDAVSWIIETVRSQDPLWLVAVGPLTNVALAFREAPDIVDRLLGICWMGGSSTVGNVTPSAEFNAWADPEAADEVFRCGHGNLIMVGLNITHQVLLNDAWVNELRVVDSPVSSAYTSMMDFYANRQRTQTLLAGSPVHDAVAVARVTHPHLVRGVKRPVEVVVSDGPARGMTIVDQRPRRNLLGQNSEVVEWADSAALQELIFDVLSST